MFLIAELSTDSPPTQCTMRKFQVSKGGVAFRISNFVSRLEENITFTFYFISFASNSPCKQNLNEQNSYFFRLSMSDQEIQELDHFS